jgi:hypothetical protein
MEGCIPTISGQYQSFVAFYDLSPENSTTPKVRKVVRKRGREMRIGHSWSGLYRLLKKSKMDSRFNAPSLVMSIKEYHCINAVI